MTTIYRIKKDVLPIADAARTRGWDSSRLESPAWDIVQTEHPAGVADEQDTKDVFVQIDNIYPFDAGWNGAKVAGRLLDVTTTAVLVRNRQRNTS